MWEYSVLVLAASSAGYLVGKTRAALDATRVSAALETELAVLRERLESEQGRFRAQAEELDAVRSEMSRTFADLSLDALGRNSSEFLKLAEEALQNRLNSAKGDLEGRQSAFDAIGREIKDTLHHVKARLESLEQERARREGDLGRFISLLKESTERLGGETARLSAALCNNRVQGRWGEAQLRNAIEAAGLSRYCDFSEQVTTHGGGRPDAIINLPQSRKLVIDAKVSLTALLELSSAADEASRKRCALEHAKSLKGHIKELADRNYPGSLEGALDFTVLFLPAESILATALECEPELLLFSHSKRVLLVTPVTLIGFLSLVSAGWHEVRVQENAQVIGELGRELHRRLSLFSGHLGKLGRSLQTVVKDFNATASSFESRILVQARRFEAYHAESIQELEAPEPVDTEIRMTT